MKIKIERLNSNAVIPKYAKEGDAGMDLTAVSIVYDKDGNVCYGTGLAFEIPKGYVGLLFPRSSNSKKDLLLSNSVGVIDSGYRGEVLVKFKPSATIHSYKGLSIETKWDSDNIEINFADEFIHYNIGDKIAQILILPYPQIEFEEVGYLSTSDRGIEGFGSTGK